MLHIQSVHSLSLAYFVSTCLQRKGAKWREIARSPQQLTLVLMEKKKWFEEGTYHHQGTSHSESTALQCNVSDLHGCLQYVHEDLEN